MMQKKGVTFLQNLGHNRTSHKKLLGCCLASVMQVNPALGPTITS